MGKPIAALFMVGTLLMSLLVGCGKKAAVPPTALFLVDSAGQPVGEMLTVPPGQTSRYTFAGDLPEGFKVERVSVSSTAVLTAAWNENQLLVRSAAQGEAAILLVLSAPGYSEWEYRLSVTVDLPEIGLYLGAAEDNDPSATARYEDGALTLAKGESYRLAISSEEGARLSYHWSGLAATAALDGRTLVITAQQEGTGTVTLTATREGAADAQVSIPVTVVLPMAAQPVLSSLDFDPSNPVLEVGKEYAFTLKDGPADCRWTVEADPVMAQVTQSEGETAQVLPLTTGTLTLQARVEAAGYQAATYSYTMQVVDHLPTLELASDSLVAGSDRVVLPLHASLPLAYTTDGEFTYTYPQDLLAGKEGENTLTFTPFHAGKGEVVLTARKEGVPDAVRRIQVEVLPSSLELTASQLSVDIDMLSRPRVELTVSEQEAHLRVSISAPIARVMIQDGVLVISPTQEGEAVITVMAEKEDFTPAVVEIPLAVGLQQITLLANTDQVVTQVGRDAQVAFTMEPADATVEVTVDGSMAVVYYQEGVMSIEPKAAGETNITVTASKPGYASEKLTIHLEVLEETDPLLPESSSPQPSRDAQQLLALVNSRRTQAGQEALKESAALTAAAQIRAEESAQSFSHTRPDGTRFSTVLGEKGISYSACGENIASGQSTPEQAVASWMESEEHRTALLDPLYTQTGIACYRLEDGTCYWVQLFLRK